MSATHILLLSGGLDSTVLLHDLLSQKRVVRCLLFDYGQRHCRELDFARATCRELKVLFTQVELHRIKDLFLRCAITDGKADSVIVPNRNGVLLNIAAAMAAGYGIKRVVFGATAEDHDGFPDCRREWVRSLNATLELAELGVKVEAPYIHRTKREIVRIGRNLGVDFTKTWSCYAGERKPCNKCDACKKRRKAFS